MMASNVGTDAWGNPTKAADLTSGMLRGGTEPLDIYRHIDAGINGTPMPSFRDTLKSEPATIWNLVSYVLHVAEIRREGNIPDSGILEDGLLKPLPGVVPGSSAPASATPRAERPSGPRPRAGTHPRRGAVKGLPPDSGGTALPAGKDQRGSMAIDLESKLQELERLKSQVERLENEIAAARTGPGWRATGYYGAYYATAGFLLGSLGAIVSLLVNMIGAPLAGKSPLELIRVYLTFPLGERRSSSPTGRRPMPSTTA